MTQDQLDPIRARVAQNHGFKSPHPDVNQALRDREVLLEEVDRLQQRVESPTAEERLRELRGAIKYGVPKGERVTREELLEIIQLRLDFSTEYPTWFNWKKASVGGTDHATPPTHGDSGQEEPSPSNDKHTPRNHK